ncbi:MAG: alanine--tRNA ligase [Phycisphaerales bacterium]|nr:alanine--tRNA ligase [Phycisphaerales bacterium]
MTADHAPSRTTSKIRAEFLEFFRDTAGHEIVPSAPVVPHDDPTLLFTNAGMNQFKDVFLGTGTRPWSRVVDTQKCIRAGGKHNDLEDVGRDTWHHTFFEMLGNWSFGDYFKADAIRWAWQLLTEVWGLPKDRLYVTVFGGDAEDGVGPDEETEQLWREVTDIDHSHISRWGRKDNFWEMGATGPCGPCSEIHFDSTPDGSGAALVNLDHPDVIEIWNLVFIQFNRIEDGSLTPLPARHVDTGMGLERIARVLQGKRSNYDTDLWAPLFKAIKSESGAPPYGGDDENPTDVAYRVLADHARCLAAAIADGARPGPEGRGYVLRRILRRGVRIARQTLGVESPLLCKIIPAVCETIGETFPEIVQQADDISSIIRSEEEAFLRTLDRGLALFAEAAQDGTISGEDAFQLHDTFGFPIDLTAQMATEQGISLDRKGYEQAMEAARSRSRLGGGSIDSVLALTPDAIAALEALGSKETDDSPKYERTRCLSHVRGIWNGRELTENAAVGDRVAVVLDRTAFYGEQGGQVGDAGRLITEGDGDCKGGSIFQVETTVRSGPWVLHVGHVTEGSLHLGNPVDTRVDQNRHHAIECNHTATHLLNLALRKVLGGECEQRGSQVAEDRLRFDYTAQEVPAVESIEQIEGQVNAAREADLKIDADNMPLERAQSISGVRAVFGERYPDPVRVVAIGADVSDLSASPDLDAWSDLSIEFCGGTHLDSTSAIGDFIVVQEQGLAAGIRRISALTGTPAAECRQRGNDIIARIEKLDGLSADELPSAVDELARDVTESELGLVHRRTAEHALEGWRKQAKSARKAAAGASRETAVDGAKQLVDSSNEPFIIGEIDAADRDSLLAAMDTVRGLAPEMPCLLACRSEEAGKAIIAARVPEDGIAKGLRAGDWVKIAAEACGGGGGGRPDAAQAGGKDPEKLPEALEAATRMAEEMLK